MSKMSELARLMTELKRCGEILIGVSETLTEMFCNGAEGKEVVKTAPEQETITENPSEATDTGEQQPEKKEEPKPLTIEEVRAVLAEKSRAGHTAKVKELLAKHGSANRRLSEIKPAEYAALLADAEVL